MAYVPPALRKKQDAVLKGATVGQPTQWATGTGARELPSIDDIQKHFWPTTLRQSTSNIPSDRHVVDQANLLTDPHAKIHVEEDKWTSKTPPSRPRHATVNATEAQPDRLEYVLLFDNANPLWKSDHVIFVKSDLHLLPRSESALDDRESADEALSKGVMIFEQSPIYTGGATSKTRFQFLGYYRLKRLQILKPRSAELTRMLEQKWTRTNIYGRPRQIQRESASWKKSLDHTWAVLKSERGVGTDEELPAPSTEVGQADDEASVPVSKPVNELLRALRSRDNATN